MFVSSLFYAEVSPPARGFAFTGCYLFFHCFNLNIDFVLECTYLKYMYTNFLWSKSLPKVWFRYKLSCCMYAYNFVCKEIVGAVLFGSPKSTFCIGYPSWFKKSDMYILIKLFTFENKSTIWSIFLDKELLVFLLLVLQLSEENSRKKYWCRCFKRGAGFHGCSRGSLSTCHRRYFSRN